MESASAPRMVTLEAFTVVGLEKVCANDGNSDIPALWDQFFQRIKELEGIKDYYGVCLPRQDGVAGFRYLACVTMKEDSDAPEGMVKVVVPAAKYAVYPFHDKVTEMPKAFDEIFGTRLAAAGLKADPSHQCLEFYPSDCWDEATGTIKADLHIAIK